MPPTLPLQLALVFPLLPAFQFRQFRSSPPSPATTTQLAIFAPPIMDHIRQAISQGNFDNLVRICEDYELGGALNLSSSPSGSSSAPALTSPSAQSSFRTAADPLVYPILLLAYLISNDLPAARDLVRRTPQSLRVVRNFAILVRLTNALWQRDLPTAYTLLANIENETAPTANGNDAGANQLIYTLVKSLETTLRERTFKLLGRAYASISASDAATHLGLGSPSDAADSVLRSGHLGLGSPSDAADSVLRSGWALDQGWLIPPVPAATSLVVNAKLGKPEGPGLEELANLTGIVVNLERA
ncbi:COP9 signalosome complex subunit 8 [Borealophlyctis nickersoniae]|nr:COP9 signalosome complex subunit 8 [Borealophlyctis nickersoniae]